MGQKVNALSFEGNGIENCIQTPVKITNLFDTSKVLHTFGIWDTGATDSVITASVVKSLGLIPIGQKHVRGVHGVKVVNEYYVEITLNNENISNKAKVTECDELSSNGSVGLLIGMIIISLGDFAITNYGGKTVMTFRIPSLQRIDFVEGIRKHTPLVNDKIPGRNDLCPCGSGRKYKNCCMNKK